MWWLSGTVTLQISLKQLSRVESGITVEVARLKISTMSSNIEVARLKKIYDELKYKDG